MYVKTWRQEGEANDVATKSTVLRYQVITLCFDHYLYLLCYHFFLFLPSLNNIPRLSRLVCQIVLLARHHVAIRPPSKADVSKQCLPLSALVLESLEGMLAWKPVPRTLYVCSNSLAATIEKIWRLKGNFGEGTGEDVQKFGKTLSKEL